MDEELFSDIVSEAFAALERLDAATKKYGESAVSQNGRVLETMRLMTAEINKQKELLQSLNGKTDSGKNQYATLKNDVPEATRQFVSFSDTLKRNNDLLNTNAQVVDQLRARVAQLKQESDSLDTTTKKGAQTLRANAREMAQITRTVDQLSRATEKAKQKTDAAEGSYRHLSEQTAQLKKQLKELPYAFDSVTNRINVNNKAAVELQKRVDASTRALKMMDSQMGDNQRKVGSYGEALGGFAGQLVGITSGAGAVMLAFQGIKKALEITAEMERLDAGLRAVSRDNDDFRRSQTFLREESDLLGVKYESLIKTYKLLKAATRDTSLEGESTEHIFHALTNAGAKLQLSNEEVEGSLYAISQMIRKGHGSGEGLRQQLGERLPGAMRIMQEVTGKTGDELDKMMKKGQLLATDVLPGFAKRLDEIYGGNAHEKIMTMTAGWNRMTNQAQQFIASFNENKAVSNFFGIILSGIADFTRDLTTLVKSDQWGAFFGLLTGNSTGIAVAAGQRAADAMAAKQTADFRALPKAERDLKVKAQQQAANDARQQLEKAQALPKTEENLEKVAALQKEYNKQLARANYLYQQNVSRSAEETRNVQAKAREQAEANKRQQEEKDKEAKAAAQLAKQQASEAVGVSRAETDTLLSKLDLKRQDGDVSERDYFKQRLKITTDGLEKEQAILRKYGQQETDDYKKIQSQKLDAKTAYNRDILKLDLSESKKTTDSAIAEVTDKKEQGLISEADFVERRYQITIGGIRDRQRIVDAAGKHESQQYKDLETEILDADRIYYKDRLKVAQDAWDLEYQQLKKSLADTDELVDANLKERLGKIEQAYNKSVNNVKILQTKGLINDQEAERRLYDIKMQHIQDVSRATLAANETEESVIKAAYDERIAKLTDIANDESKTAAERKAAEKEIAKYRVDLENRIAKLRKEGIDVATDAEVETGETKAERELEIEKRKADNKKAIVEAGFQLTQMLGDAAFSADQQRIEQQMRDLDKQKDFELSLVGDNEAAKAAIEKKYDDQRKVLQHQQDVQNREKAIFDILINTAVNVVKLLANPLAAGIAAALGFAQLAIVQSAKYPEYAEGKNVDLIDKYVGPAIVGEAGRELHFDEKGNVKLYDKRTKIDVGANDVILPNRQTDDLLNDLSAFEANRLLHMNQRQGAILNDTLQAQRQQRYSAERFPVSAIKNAIKEAHEERPYQEWNVENGELAATFVTQNTRIKGMRNSHQLKGR